MRRTDYEGRGGGGGGGGGVSTFPLPQIHHQQLNTSLEPRPCLENSPSGVWAQDYSQVQQDTKT